MAINMHGGRVPYDEQGALTGPARTVVAETSVTSPNDLWDIIEPVPDVDGEYPTQTGWRDIGLAVDAPEYSHGGSQSGLAYQQPTGELFQVVDEVTRNITIHIADFREDNLKLLENSEVTAAVAAGAAASGETAGTKVYIGLYTDLKVVRVAMISYRPVGAEVVDEGATTRPTAVALIIPKAQLTVNDKTVSPAKGAGVDAAIQLSAQVDAAAPAGGEHGFWFIETAGTAP